MDPKFEKFLIGIHSKFEQLLAMTPVTMESPIFNSPEGGIYLFSENGTHLYVGRSKRQLSKRLRGHIRNSSKDSPLAFKLAREATGNTDIFYSGDNIRSKLLADPNFSKVYQDAKDRIKKMEIRWVHEPEPIKQALLEMYVAVILDTPYNDFDTH
jgi:hypothetical protein